MDELVQLRQFLLERFGPKYQDIVYANVPNFMESNQDMYRILHQDIKRSLWRYLGVFENNAKESIRRLQAIFEHFIIDVWSNLPNELQGLYYQGISDPIEIVFGSFLNFNRMQQRQNWFDTDESDFRPFFSDIADFFYDEYSIVVDVAVESLILVYQFNKFDLAHMRRLGEELVAIIKQNDKKLYQLIEQVDQQTIVIFLHPYVNTFFIHNTNNLQISQKLMKFLCTYNEKGIIHMLQFVLSTCTHSFCPELKQDPKEVTLHVPDPIVIENPQINGIQIVNQAVEVILTNKVNCYMFGELLDSFYDEHLKRYSEK